MNSAIKDQNCRLTITSKVNRITTRNMNDKTEESHQSTKRRKATCKFCSKLCTYKPSATFRT